MKKKTTPYRSAQPFIKKLLKDPEVRILYEEEKANTLIARAVKEARLKVGFTQAQLAKRASTTQAVISRVESGRDSRIPSLALLARIAASLRAHLTFGFSFKKAA